MRYASTKWSFSGILAMSLLAANISAQDVKYVEENGVTYQETRRVIQRPIMETKMVPQEQTRYRTQYRTELQPSQRHYNVPITEYRWEPEWVGRWNPFATPYVTYRWKPVTRWEPRTETVQIPYTRTEVIPEKVTTNVPVTTPRYVNEEHFSRVPVSARTQGVGPSDPFDKEESGVASRETIGGVRRLDSDPPREGDWRPSESIRR
jgi:hypothetical protein